MRFNDQKPEDGGAALVSGSALGGERDMATPNRLSERDLSSSLVDIGDHRRAFGAKLVKKVGNRGDTLTWAEDVAQVAQGRVEWITQLTRTKGACQEEFQNFLAHLQKNLNPLVEAEEAIRTLAQHMVTKPVFEALFENYSFAKNNPVSQSLEGMVELLESKSLKKDAGSLQKFYDQTREKISSLDDSQIKRFVSGIDNSVARQKIIIDLYNNFFKIAFKEDTDKLGIVYTPVELVDFIINSVAEVLKREFDRDISDKNVHILDPFTGAGTFISRLIQSGLLGDNLAYKYAHDLHCNEIMLLPYYIASITIENAYHEIVGEDKGYQAFKGICLTDSFQLHESEDSKIQFDQLFRENSERAEAQKTAPIMVIIGNPPYAKSQDDAEKNIKNIPYPILDNRIRNTYAKLSEANLKNALYDPYIKAFRWSSDRLDDNNGGIISFVTNAGWLDGSATDGLRKCLTDEFSSIFVFNLRGNQRTSGEMSKKEGGKIFGSGSRAAIAITVMVKNPAKKGPAKIFYSDIGDYLSRERKLALISQRRDIYNHDMTWDLIKPNSAGDWLNQRSALFEKFIPISDKNNKNNINTIFSPRYSAGLVTSRDAWCYNFSSEHLKLNIESAISFYNSQVVNFLSAKKSDSSLQAKNCIKRDLKYFSWDIKQFIDIDNGMLYKFNNKSLVLSLYRPFQKINCYFNRDLNYRVYLNQSLFPTNHHDNLLICASGVGASKDFSCLISNLVADFQLQLNTQCFPRYYYEPVDEKQKTLFTQSIGGYIRHDGVTDYILKECRSKYGQKVTKDHIFYYVYGLLHSKDYRETFAADLKKMLPRIFLVKNAEDFDSFHQAGKALAKLHLNYETVTPYSKVKLIGVEKGNFIVDKIRFIDKDDKTAIQYNPFIKITGIPLAAYEYVINGRSAIEWILDRYQVKVNKASGLENDPNDWAKEHKEPRYILDLLLRIITVSLETRKIVNSLPRLKF